MNLKCQKNHFFRQGLPILLDETFSVKIPLLHHIEKREQRKIHVMGFCRDRAITQILIDKSALKLFRLVNA